MFNIKPGDLLSYIARTGSIGLMDLFLRSEVPVKTMVQNIKELQTSGDLVIDGGTAVLDQVLREAEKTQPDKRLQDFAMNKIAATDVTLRLSDQGFRRASAGIRW